MPDTSGPTCISWAAPPESAKTAISGNSASMGGAATVSSAVWKPFRDPGGCAASWKAWVMEAMATLTSATPAPVAMTRNAAIRTATLATSRLWATSPFLRVSSRRFSVAGSVFCA